MMRRRVLLGAAAAILAASWVGVGRPVARVLRVSQSAFRAPPLVTDRHIDLLRNLRIAWSFSIEGGGPMVDPVAPYGASGMPPLAWHREVIDLLVWLLANRPLAPGNYPLAHLGAAEMEALVRAEMANLPVQRIEALVAQFRLVPDAGRFSFSEAHRRLLPHLAWEWPGLDIAPLLTRRALIGAPVPTVDFKRPFGYATNFALDMADILNLPAPRTVATAAPMYRLYDQLWPALQVYVQNVPIEVGRVTD